MSEACDQVNSTNVPHDDANEARGKINANMIRSLLPRAICTAQFIFGDLGGETASLVIFAVFVKTPQYGYENQRNPGNGQHHAQYQGHDEFDGVDITQISSDEIIGQWRLEYYQSPAIARLAKRHLIFKMYHPPKLGNSGV